MSTKAEPTNVMIDLETLGTKPGCIILSVAAIPFHSTCLQPVFYEKISQDSCISSGLVSDPDTIAWWNKQNPLVRNEAFSGTKHLIEVLDELALWMADLPTRPLIWGNGADFDAPILAAAFGKCGLKLPWSYGTSRCYRTLKNLFPAFDTVRAAVSHNALEDAIAQAANATRMLEWIESGGPSHAA